MAWALLSSRGTYGRRSLSQSDQEPSIVALKNAIAAARFGETVPIESPVRASKSNGMMEHAVKIWQGQLRTIKHDGGSRLGKRIEPGSALVTWLIPFCADILNKFRVGVDGRTACERITSHTCKVAQIGFVEVVDFKLETVNEVMMVVLVVLFIVVVLVVTVNAVAMAVAVVANLPPSCSS